MTHNIGGITLNLSYITCVVSDVIIVTIIDQLFKSKMNLSISCYSLPNLGQVAVD